MGDGPPGFRRNSSCSAVLRIHRNRPSLRIRDCYPLWPAFPDRSARDVWSHRCPTTPARRWFGLFPFRSPLLRESIFLSLPPGTKMFQFPGSTSVRLCIHRAVALMCGVPPFGNLWFNAYLQLPRAYRCWFRPSSALGAKASTVRPSLLNRNEIVSVPAKADTTRVFLNSFGSRFSTLDFRLKIIFRIVSIRFSMYMKNSQIRPFKTEYNMSSVNSVRP